MRNAQLRVCVCDIELLLMLLTLVSVEFTTWGRVHESEIQVPSGNECKGLHQPMIQNYADFSMREGRIVSVSLWTDVTHQQRVGNQHTCFFNGSPTIELFNDHIPFLSFQQ